MMQKPPPYGSLLEFMCIVVQRDEANLGLLQTRAQAQASLGGDSAEAAFKEYAAAFSRVEVEDTQRKMREQVEKLKDIQEIRFQPIGSIQKQIKLPVVDASVLRDKGLLRDQIRIASTPRRPERARTQRKTR